VTTIFLRRTLLQGINYKILQACIVFCMNRITDTIKVIKVTDENVEMNVETVPSFETSANVYQTTRRPIPEDSTLYSSSV
jgi:hypothetical protein